MPPPTAGEILRTARRDSRLSQTDLARRAGVAQSVISVYESGRREPSLATLSKLVTAAGHELQLVVVPATGRRRGLPDTPLGRRLRRHRGAVIKLATDRGARNVRVFGSVARGEDTDESDVDLLVDLDQGVGLIDLIGLERELNELLDVRVDVVPANSLKPRIRESILDESIPL